MLGLSLAAATATLVSACASGTTAGTPAPTHSPGCPTSITVTSTDSQKTLCVAVGGTVTVDLSSPNGSRWQAPETGGILQQVGTPGPAESGGQRVTYTAKSAGTATILSSHAACPSSPGTISCHALQAWRVTIDVR